MSILEYQPLSGKSPQHLINMAAAKRFCQHSVRVFDDILNRKLLIAVFQPRNYR